MRLVARLYLLLGLMFILALAGCGGGAGKSPVASDSEEEVGSVSEKGGDDSFDEFSEEKPAQYTAKEGDTLRRIAGRPEVYGDPELWPLLQQANEEAVGDSQRVNKGTVLKIPRDATDEEKAEAREKARQVSAQQKMRAPADTQVPGTAADAAAAVTTGAEAAPAAAPAPVPPAKKGKFLLPVLLILLLVLVVAAVVLLYFMKKDSGEEEEQQ